MVHLLWRQHPSIHYATQDAVAITGIWLLSQHRRLSFLSSYLLLCYFEDLCYNGKVCLAYEHPALPPPRYHRGLGLVVSLFIIRGKGYVRCYSEFSGEYIRP